jgi:hypothetical protein
VLKTQLALSCTINDVALVAVTTPPNFPVAPPTAVVGVMMIDLGAAPYALLNVTTVVQTTTEFLPAVIVNDPTVSVDAAVMAELGGVPKAVGLTMVGAFV